MGSPYRGPIVEEIEDTPPGSPSRLDNYFDDNDENLYNGNVTEEDELIDYKNLVDHANADIRKFLDKKRQRGYLSQTEENTLRNVTEHRDQAERYIEEIEKRRRDSSVSRFSNVMNDVVLRDNHQIDSQKFVRNHQRRTSKYENNDHIDDDDDDDDEQPIMRNPPQPIQHKAGRSQNHPNHDRQQTQQRRKRRSQVVCGRKRYRPGVRALNEIRQYQKSTNLLIQKSPVQRLVKQITQEMFPSQILRFQTDAMHAIHEAAEAFLVQVMEGSYMCTVHAKRVTLSPSDIHLYRRLVLHM